MLPKVGSSKRLRIQAITSYTGLGLEAALGVISPSEGGVQGLQRTRTCDKSHCYLHFTCLALHRGGFWSGFWSFIFYFFPFETGLTM